MPNIEIDDRLTVVIEFEVEPSHQSELIESLADSVEQHFGIYPGFISASFHASNDGRRIINYAQWQSEKSWNEFRSSTTENDEGQAEREAAMIRCGAKAVSIGAFRVARVVENV